MGPNQSSTNGTAKKEMKTSYYELLGVERHATDDQIKKAYRKKALELHPDRNHGNEEHATMVFAEVQSAYEVLSDPNERAWYDMHEPAILSGENFGGVPMYDGISITTADDLARLVPKFNGKVAFTDAPSGFFGFLRETFARLAKEEEMAASWGISRDNTKVPEYPSFGRKDDGYDPVVKRFYNTWSAFSTVKSFTWCDPYQESGDRQTRRYAEQENRKARNEGIREFNDAVRSLVALVRKRDPRYVPTEQTEAEREKILRDAAAAQAARARAENEVKMKAEVPEWAKSRDPDPLADMVGDFEEAEETEEEEVLECVACNKIFKSEKQWESHEKSKKHQKAVYALQKKMRKDNANLGLNNDPAEPTALDTHGEEPANILDDVVAESTDSSIRANESTDSEDDAANIQTQEPCGSMPDDAVEDDMTQHANSENENSDCTSPESIENRLRNTGLNDELGPSPAAGIDELGDNPNKRMGKAAQKRAKKAVAAARGDQPEAKQKCSGCDAAFPTRTQLFQHLKRNPNHVALKTEVVGGGRAKKKAKGKK